MYLATRGTLDLSHKMCSFFISKMIRSRNIPPLLSRITGDGINAALLVTADGALLGSSSDVAPVDQPSATNASTAATAVAAGSSPAAANAASPPDGAGGNPNAPADQQQRLDYTAIGALVAEVAADYQRLGIELNHLDPRAALQLQQQQAQQAQPPSSSAAAAGAASPTPNTATSEEATSPSSAAGASSATGTAASGAASAASKAKAPTGNTLRCMIVEMDGGTIGVSSAGASDCYVVAMADADVEHGLLRARLTALSDHCAEAFTTMA